MYRRPGVDDAARRSTSFFLTHIVVLDGRGRWLQYRGHTLCRGKRWRRHDRARKLPLYTRAGVPEAWLVDLQGESIKRHTNPVEGAYRDAVRVGRGEEIASLAIPGLVLKADDVLG